MGFETKIDFNGCRNELTNGNGVMFHDDDDDDEKERDEEENFGASMASSPTPPLLSSSSSPLRYIEHRVTKLDTLAGVAIRYGVEVADIKKMNGLVTDLQMFALKSLQIPLPGRHPPSPCLSNGHDSAGSDQTPSQRMHSDLLETFQSLKLTPDRNPSSAMSSLRDFYGLNGRRYSSEGYELAVYNNGSSTSYPQNEGFSTSSSLMNPPLNQNRRSRSVANGLKTEEHESANDVHAHYRKWIDNLNIRPQKTDDSRTPEKLLKDENGSGGWFSRISGKKGLALRAKTASPTNLASTTESSGENGFLCNLGESSIIAQSSSGVRKSSSTPTLQDQDGNGNTSIWSVSNWSLTPELQAAFANPIFDGLPKPITGRRGKAAMD